MLKNGNEGGKFSAGRWSEQWGFAKWAVFSPSGVRVRDFPDDSRESGIAAKALADALTAERQAAK